MKWLAVIAVILKFIGIAVLLLLAILLLVILIIMLSPVKYGADGAYNGGTGNGKAFISYLFGLIRFDISYDNGLVYSLKIPFVDVQRLLSSGDKTDDKNNNNNNSDNSADSADSINSIDSDNSTNSDDSTDFDNSDNFDTDEAADLADESKLTDFTEPTEDKPKDTVHQGGAKQKSKSSKHKSKAFGKPKNKSGRDLSSIYNMAVSFFKEYEPAKLYGPIKRFLKRFFKALGVKTALVDAIFGFDDPSLTGVVLGGASALAAFLPIKLRLSGYFEGSFLKGNAELKGKTCLLALLVPIIRLVFEKPVWNILTKSKG